MKRRFVEILKEELQIIYAAVGFYPVIIICFMLAACLLSVPYVGWLEALKLFVEYVSLLLSFLFITLLVFAFMDWRDQNV